MLRVSRVKLLPGHPWWAHYATGEDPKPVIAWQIYGDCQVRPLVRLAGSGNGGYADARKLPGFLRCVPSS